MWAWILTLGNVKDIGECYMILEDFSIELQGYVALVPFDFDMFVY